MLQDVFPSAWGHFPLFRCVRHLELLPLASKRWHHMAAVVVPVAVVGYIVSYTFQC